MFFSRSLPILSQIWLKFDLLESKFEITSILCKYKYVYYDILNDPKNTFFGSGTQIERMRYKYKSGSLTFK